MRLKVEIEFTTEDFMGTTGLNIGGLDFTTLSAAIDSAQQVMSAAADTIKKNAPAAGASTANVDAQKELEALAQKLQAAATALSNVETPVAGTVTTTGAATGTPGASPNPVSPSTPVAPMPAGPTSTPATPTATPTGTVANPAPPPTGTSGSSGNGSV